MDRLKLLMDDTDQDLTTQQGVVTLMESSKSEKEWNDNCDEVKEAIRDIRNMKGEIEDY